MDIAARQDFYASVPVFRGFARLMDPALYVRLPDDWTVGIADVVQSTAAIAAKRYKAVNMAGAAVIAAVTTFGLLQTRAEIAELRVMLATWQARVADAERSAQASQATLVTYRRQLDVMTADDLLLVSLSGLPPANAAQAKAFVSRSQNAILFTARDLPALPAARVYQLWAVAGGQAISAGTFVPDARGRTQLVADVPALTTRPDALAVTVEPEGGVPAPTGPKYLLGVPAN